MSAVVPVPISAVSRSIRFVSLFHHVLTNHIIPKMGSDPDTATEEEQNELALELARFLEFTLVEIYPNPEVLALDLIALKAFEVVVYSTEEARPSRSTIEHLD